MVVAESSATGGLIVIKSDLSSAPQDGMTPPDAYDDERMASQLELMGDFAELNATSDQIMNLDDVDKNSTTAKSSLSDTKDESNEDSAVDDVVWIAEEHGTKQGPLVNTTSDKQVQLSNDRDLITEAEKHIQEERLLEGARALRRVNDQSLLQDKHRRALRKAMHVEAAVVDLTSSPDRGWIKQGESHGSYDTIIYYKVDENTRLTARIETPIDASLLVPLLSVFNESELYESCLPHFQGLGIHRSIKLRQMGRGNQIIAVNSNMPWPLANREAIIEAIAIDDISTNNHIVIKMETRCTGEEDGLIPPPEEGVVRVDFDGGLLF